MCIQQQIEVDKRKRQAIESAKASELAAEVAELNQWQSDLRTQEKEDEEKSESVRSTLLSMQLIADTSFNHLHLFCAEWRIYHCR